VYLRYLYRAWAWNPAAIEEEAVQEYLRCFRQPGAMRAGFEDYEGYVPEGVLRGVDPEPWQGEDYLTGELCLDCGKLQGEFPAQIEVPA